MVTEVRVRRNAGTPEQREEWVWSEELNGAQGTRVVYHPEASLILTDKHQGRLVVLTNTSPITLTIPSTLRAGFSCGWCQANTGVITFQAGAGVSLRALNAWNKSVGQNAVGGVARFPDGDFIVYGQMQ